MAWLGSRRLMFEHSVPKALSFIPHVSFIQSTSFLKTPIMCVIVMNKTDTVPVLMEHTIYWDLFLKQVHQWFSTRGDFIPGGCLECLFLVVTPMKGKCPWHLVTRGQVCY